MSNYLELKLCCEVWSTLLNYVKSFRQYKNIKTLKELSGSDRKIFEKLYYTNYAFPFDKEIT